MTRYSSKIVCALAALSLCVAGCEKSPEPGWTEEQAPVTAAKAKSAGSAADAPAVKEQPASESVPSLRGAATCEEARKGAAAALAKKDAGAFVALLDPSVVRDTSRALVVPANFAIAGHAQSFSGAPGTVDALAAILNRHGGMMTVEERMAGLTFDEMEEHTYGRVEPHVDAFFADLLAWADAAGYPGDIEAAVSVAPAPKDRMITVVVDPKKGLLDSIADAKIPDSMKDGAAQERAPESASSLKPLITSLSANDPKHRPQCVSQDGRFYLARTATKR